MLIMMVLSTMQSVVLALGIVCAGLYYYPSPSIAFTACRQQRHQFSSSLFNDVRTLYSLQPLAASEGDFFSDGNASSSGSGGSFFEEVEKQKPPPSQEKKDEEPMTLEEVEMMATEFDEHLPKINTVTLVGRVGNDPEPRYFDDGKVVLNLSLAVKRKYHSLERKVRNIRSGEEETDWFPLEFWGRDAEYVTNYVEKGSRLGITGSLTQDGWVDKMTGEQRRKAKIIVRHIDILESKAEAELRKSNKGSYDGNSSGGGRGGNNYDNDDDGPASAGTGGFFS